jgi:hypothetical protein
MKKLYLPLEEAIKVAALQNIDRDIRCNLLSEDNMNDDTYMNLYTEEARLLLEAGGMNYTPKFPDHPLIIVI